MTRRRVGVIGAGYVGLTTAVCLAEADHDTVCVDVDVDKVEALSRAVTTLDEPGLPLLLERGLGSGALRFASDYAALADRDVVFVCVSTPSAPDGSTDLSFVDAAVAALADVLRPGSVVALKSTVPVGTTRHVAEEMRGTGISVVANPEFLREGHVIYDFLHPDRIIVGADDEDSATTVAEICASAATFTLWMSPESAEVAKYASNAFLAVKISYANSIAGLCTQVGANIDDVTRCMGADVRIGGHFLAPGPGWGGSCLPKDTASLLHSARVSGVELAEVAAARETNAAQPARVARSLEREMGVPLPTARVTALGLTFKAGTNDVRDSPALTICGELIRAGALVTGFDPKVNSIDPVALRRSSIVIVDDPYLAAKDADAIVVLTEWPEFRDLDWSAIAEQAPNAVVLDTRNLLDAAVLAEAGLRHIRNGVPGGF